MNNRLPAITVGSLIGKSEVGCLSVFIRELMSDGDKNRPDELSDTVSRLFRMSPRRKNIWWAEIRAILLRHHHQSTKQLEFQRAELKNLIIEFQLCSSRSNLRL